MQRIVITFLRPAFTFFKREKKNVGLFGESFGFNNAIDTKKITKYIHDITLYIKIIIVCVFYFIYNTYRIICIYLVNILMSIVRNLY